VLSLGFAAMKKLEYPTPFQRAFFDQLEAIKAASMEELTELARQQGIPRECARAFWETQQRAKRPVKTADVSRGQEPAA